MKSNDVRIGMKVVPFQKTVGIMQDNFRQILTVRTAIERRQPYLYIVGWHKYDKCWRLSDTRDGGGDFFNSKDFHLYTGENNEI